MPEQYTDEMLEEQEHDTQETQEHEDQVSVSPEEFAATQAALKKANREAAQRRKELAEMREMVSQYQGIDLDEVRSLQQEKEEREMRLAEEKGNVEKIKQHHLQEKAKLEEQFQGKISELQSSLEKAVIDTQLTSAMSELGAKAKFLTPLIRDKVKLEKNDAGDHVARVLDDDGTYRLNRSGDYMTPKEFIAELREEEEYGIFFNARGQSGSGTQSAPTQGKKPVANKPRSQFSQAERKAFIKENGWDAWDNLPV